jgi:hypothetical protein
LSKLTKHQRDELKSLVANATVRRLTAKETSAFVLERLGVSISIDHIRHLKTDIKRDCARELQSLQNDRDYYVQCLFWDRVHELEYQQRVLHEIIDGNKQSNPDVVVRAVNVLHNISSSIFQEYSNLPALSSFRFPILPEPEPLGPSSQRPQGPSSTYKEAGEYATVAQWFRDIPDDMSVVNVQNMVSAIRLVNNVGYNLPPGMKASATTVVLLASFEVEVKTYRQLPPRFILFYSTTIK